MLDELPPVLEMPLANTPFRPLPRLELLASRKITFAEATSRLGEFLRTEVENLEVAESDSAFISAKQLPDVHAKLKDDWSQARGMQPSACFVEVHARLEVHLPPGFLGPKLAMGLRKAVAPLLLRHDIKLGCVPLNYEALKTVGNCGAIVGESPYVHFLVEFRSVGFAPKPGDWIVCRTASVQQKWGVSVLILNHFAGLVPQLRTPASLSFNQKTWVDDRDRPLVHDSVARFCVKKVHFEDMHARIEGELEWNSSLVHAPDGDYNYSALTDVLVAPKKRKSSQEVLPLTDGHDDHPLEKKKKTQQKGVIADSTATGVATQSEQVLEMERKKKATTQSVDASIVQNVEEKRIKPTKKDKKRKKEVEDTGDV